MKKQFFSLLALVSIMLVGGVSSTWAEEKTATFDLASFTAANPLTFSDDASGISLQFNKTSGTVDCQTNNRGVRWQQSTDFTITVPTGYHITEVVLTSGNNGNFSKGNMDVIISSADANGAKGDKIEDWTTISAKAESYTWSNPSNLLNDAVNFSFTGSGDIYVNKVDVKCEENSSSVAASITTAQTSFTIEQGNSATLNVVASGLPTPTLQWYQCDDENKTNAAAISDATEASYEFTPSATGTYYFYCVATNTTEGTTNNASSDIITVNVVNKILSNDNSIASIVVNGLTATKSGTGYSVTTLNYQSETVTATVTTTDANATVDGGNTLTATIGEELTIKVTAEDGTVATYTLTVKNANDEIVNVNEYYVSNDKTYAAGQSIICPYITAQISETSEAARNMTIDGSKTNYVNGSYTTLVIGTNNPDYNSTSGIPTSGSYFTFTPSRDGTLEIGVNLGADKELYVSDGSNRLTAGTDFTALFKTKDGEVTLTNGKLTVQAAGTITLDVTANTTYYVYCASSKIGWSGLKFSANAFTLTTEDTDLYSLYLDYDAAIPDNVTAYTGSLSQDETSLTLNEITGGVIPANTGVLVKSSAAGTYTFEKTEQTATISGNDLLGVLADTPVSTLEAANSGKTVLTLGLLNDEIGFRKPAGTSILANRIYLLVTTPTTTDGAKSVSIVFGGETTGISDINASKTEADAPVYNLAGQRVAAGTKGLLIKNGKKYISK